MTTDPLRTETSINILGVHPTEVIEVGPIVDEQITSRWTEYLTKGIGKEGRSELTGKYPVVQNCQALTPPKMNSEVQECLDEPTSRQDNFLTKLQEQLGKGLTALATPIDNLYLNPSDDTNTKILLPMVEAAKMIADVFHSISTHRRHQATPFLNPENRKLLEESSIDENLFGKDFTEKVKMAQQIKKTTQELRLAKPKASTSKSTSNSLNFRRFKKKPRFKRGEEVLAGKKGDRVRDKKRYNQAQATRYRSHHRPKYRN